MIPSTVVKLLMLTVALVIASWCDMAVRLERWTMATLLYARL